MLAIQSKKINDYDTKVNEIGKKITDHKHEKYITTKNFAARLAQVNLITKQILMIN